MENVKYYVLDLHTTEKCDSEDEARSVAKDWYDQSFEAGVDACRHEEEDTLERWRKEESFYRQNHDIAAYILIYKVDFSQIDEDEDISEENITGRWILDNEGEYGIELIDSIPLPSIDDCLETINEEDDNNNEEE